MVKVEYELSRPGTIARYVQDELIRRYGDGTPFRWKQVKALYEEAWSAVHNGKKIPFVPSIAVQKVLDRLSWVVQHPDSEPVLDPYTGRLYYQRWGRWRSVVPLKDYEACLEAKQKDKEYWEEFGAVEHEFRPPVPSEGTKQCTACSRYHQKPVRPKPLDFTTGM